MPLALPTWTRVSHPIVRQELRQWGRSAVWRNLRRGMWGCSVSILLAPGLCVLLNYLTLRQVQRGPAEVILTTGAGLTLGLVAVGLLANWLTGLIATLLGATLIAREREYLTWPFLRLTTLTTLDIAGGKLAALLRSLVGTLNAIAGVRLLAVLTGVVTVGLALAASGLDWRRALPELFGLLPRATLEWALVAGAGALVVVTALGGWLLEPYFSAVYNGVVGLTASSLARSRGTSIIIAIAVHFAVGIGVYGMAQQGLQLVLIGVLSQTDFMTSDTGPLLWMAVSYLAQWGVIVSLHAAVLALGAALTLARLEHLPD